MRSPFPHRFRRHGIVLAMCVALVAAACSGGSSENGASSDGEFSGAEEIEEVEEGDPVEGGSIVIGLEAETNSMIPGTASFADSGLNVAYAVFDPLMARTPDGGVEPYLAESMTPNDDLTEWTLTLRSGVKFHDGTDLDAEALKTIFDDYLTADSANTAAALDEVDEVTVDDELTITYHLSEPNAAFPDLLTTAPGFPFSPTAAEAAGEDAGVKPQGTGPFKIESWQRDHELVVVKNEDYWQEGLPHLDQITFRPIADEGTRRDSLAADTIQAAISLRQSEIVQYRELDGVDNHEAISNASGGNIINTTRAPFDDLRVRQALVMGLEQDQIIDVLGGTGITPPASQLFSKDSPWYSEAVADALLGFDPDEAEALLDDYVNDPDRSDGKAAGDPVVVDYACPPDPSLNELAQTYQALWQDVGFDVNLHQVDQSTHVSNALARNYDVGCFRFGSDQDPWVLLNANFGDGPTNFTGFRSDEIDEQLDILKQTDDVDERQAAVEAIGIIVNENAVLTQSGSTLTDIAVRDTVRNVRGAVFPNGDPVARSTSSVTFWGFAWLED